MVKSPVSGQEAQIIETRSSEEIAALYKASFGIDITSFFGSNREVTLARCPDTGLEFYAPPELAGPPEFYNELYSSEDNVDWAYQALKWEFVVAGKYVPDQARVLDIGCGSGEFLQYIADRCEATGLEQSPFGRDIALSKNLRCLDQTIEMHAKQETASYDVVTAFQVLEHVAEVRSFLAAAISALRPGGRLILAVPNNDSFIGTERNLPLNMPPHHMGRWNRASLEALGRFFDIDVKAVEIEMLQSHNTGWYTAAMERRYIPSGRLLRAIYARSGLRKAFRGYVEGQRETILGHTILIVYEKG